MAITPGCAPHNRAKEDAPRICVPRFGAGYCWMYIEFAGAYGLVEVMDFFAFAGDLDATQHL